ncbi:hypothetical protein LCGC14_2681190, partial [marine sediment metagenome]
RQIGIVCDAVRDSGQADSTVIIFTSDHGDMDSAHRMEHKCTFYDEACRVPLIVSFPGVTPGGTVDREHLVSNGLDLLPTLCDYARRDVPGELIGSSLRPLAEGAEVPAWRSWLPVECRFGRMVMTRRHKYMLYDPGEHAEQLIDLDEDPGEMHSAATDPAYEDILDRHRQLFRDHFRQP